LKLVSQKGDTNSNGRCLFLYKQDKMKISTKIFYVLGSVALGGLIVYAARAYQAKRMTQAVSEEGYETADDILFPNNKRRGDKLHYGPVLPDGFYS
jgi:hypothetical protein